MPSGVHNRSGPAAAIGVQRRRPIQKASRCHAVLSPASGSGPSATSEIRGTRSRVSRQTRTVPDIDRTLRQAVSGDIDALVSIDPVAGAGDSDRLRFISSAVSTGTCLVLADAHAVVGFIVTTPRRFFGRDFIDLLAVHPEHRRSGIGRHLLRTAVANAETNAVFTSTNRSNEPMQRLLEREGWKFSGELTGLDESDPELVFYIERPSR